jgi:hypothetical protein
MRTSLACLVLALSGLKALAAPAPMPREVADARVHLQTLSLAKVTDTIRAKTFAREVLKDSRIRGLSCLKGKANPEGWLLARLKVRPANKGSARISMENCPPKEALVLLSVVLDGYLNSVDTTLPILRRQLQSSLDQEMRIMEIVKQRAVANANIERILDRFRERSNMARQRIEQARSKWIAREPALVKSNR